MRSAVPPTSTFRLHAGSFETCSSVSVHGKSHVSFSVRSRPSVVRGRRTPTLHYIWSRVAIFTSIPCLIRRILHVLLQVRSLSAHFWNKVAPARVRCKQKFIWCNINRREYNELQASIMSRPLSRVVNLHLRAAGLHLRLAGFFDAHETPGYMDDLMGLWRATCSFLDYIMDNTENQSPLDPHGAGNLLLYATNYIQQMLVAAGFALLKLVCSFFGKSIDFERGRLLFHHTITAIRSTSVVQNDLNWRLAELMVQMWNGARRQTQAFQSQNDEAVQEIDDSLQLRVRCRHSMSLVYDSIWHWREEYQARGRGNLDCKYNAHLVSSLPFLSTAPSHLLTVRMKR